MAPDWDWWAEQLERKIEEPLEYIYPPLGNAVRRGLTPDMTQEELEAWRLAQSDWGYAGRKRMPPTEKEASMLLGLLKRRRGAERNCSIIRKDPHSGRRGREKRLGATMQS